MTRSNLYLDETKNEATVASGGQSKWGNDKVIEEGAIVRLDGGEGMVPLATEEQMQQGMEAASTRS